MDAAFFTGNRERLLEKLKHGSLVTLTAYGEMQQSNDAAFAFEQEANFWYLTGINEPDWWLVLDGLTGATMLVRPDIDDMKRVFDGCLSDEAATRMSGVKKIISRDEALRRLREASKHHSIVHTTEQLYETGFQSNHAQREMKKMLERIFKKVQACNKELAELRTIKQPEEIKALQKAIDITVDAFKRVESSLSTMKHEYEIEAEMTHEIRRKGARGHAYTPIVASAQNACTLHYTQNDAKLSKKSFVLIDVGARHDGYAADITRTYAYGAPTKRQRDVHEAVASAQSRCIELLKPGVTFDQYHDQVDQVMRRAVSSLGLSDAKYRDYFPHAIGHGLGVDVHDALAGYDTLKPGMVMTVEPGIYIPEEGIGVRIEDDILITEDGHKNLSGKLSTNY